MIKDFWNSSADKKQSTERNSDRSSDEALILPLILLLLSDEKNSELVMALLYILS